MIVSDIDLPVLGNEKQVGQAVRDSGIPREDIYVTTKLPCVFDSLIKCYAITDN